MSTGSCNSFYDTINNISQKTWLQWQNKQFDVHLERPECQICHLPTEQKRWIYGGALRNTDMDGLHKPPPIVQVQLPLNQQALTLHLENTYQARITTPHVFMSVWCGSSQQSGASFHKSVWTRNHHRSWNLYETGSFLTDHFPPRDSVFIFSLFLVILVNDKVLTFQKMKQQLDQNQEASGMPRYTIQYHVSSNHTDSLHGPIDILEQFPYKLAVIWPLQVHYSYLLLPSAITINARKGIPHSLCKESYIVKWAAITYDGLSAWINTIIYNYHNIQIYPPGSDRNRK